MTEHDGTQPSTKQRKSRKTNTANQQYDKQTPAAQRPTNDDTEAWKTHWKAGGQSWRTEPEIDLDRQKYLAERRSITPNIEKGVYSFKDIKLSRADVEWLLATHKSGDIEGAVDWSDEDQRQRKGLDLRGANLRQANLSGLPLARIRGGLEEYGEWKNASVEQRNMAAVQLQGASLMYAQLQGAYLREAELQEAYLWRAQLQGAYLRHAIGINLSPG
jgi:hypothetical protein